MATLSAFELDDQTDEEFFDKLVNDDDDDDIIASVKKTSSVGVDDFVDAKVFDNLSISDVGSNGVVNSDEAKVFDKLSSSDGGSNEVVCSGGNAHKDDVDFDLMNDCGDNVVAEDNGAFLHGNMGETANLSVNDGAFLHGNTRETSNLSVNDGVFLHGNMTETLTLSGNNGAFVHGNKSENSNLSGNNGAFLHGNMSETSNLSGNNGVFLHGNMSETANLSSEPGVGEVSGLNSDVVDTKDEDSGKGVKVVQWSSFGSDSPIRTGSKVESGSYSDFLNKLGDDSEDPFANVDSANVFRNQAVTTSDTETAESITRSFSLVNATSDLSSSTVWQYQDSQYHGSGTEQSKLEQDLTSSQYWENEYPGWQYDLATGQWNQIDGYDSNMTQTANISRSFDVNAQSAIETSVSEQTQDAYHLRQTAQSAVTNVAGKYRTDALSNDNQSSLGSGEYTSHMVFDPQYPGWYYDTIAQEWKSLESYTPPSVNYSDSVNLPQQHQNKEADYWSQSTEGQHLVTSLSSSSQQNTNVWETHEAVKSEATVFTGSQQFINQPVATSHVNNSFYQPACFEPSASVASYKMSAFGFESNNEVHRLQSFNPSEQFTQHQNQTTLDQNKQINFSPAYFANQTSMSFHQQLPEAGTNTFYANSEGRSSAGRPPHSLICFGFGGKLILMKNDTSLQTSLMAYEGKEPAGRAVNVLNLKEVVMDISNDPSYGIGAQEYFHSLCQSFPGPLVGGSFGSKELNKWIDEQITTCESPYYRNGATKKLLFSLLKISCQHYGKLRLPYGTDQGLQESDCPELAVAELFSSAKNHFAQTTGYQSVQQCVQKFPSEAQIQGTALQVQKLLVSGRKKEALQCAQEGQLWGPALVLASQLGDRFYGDTVKQMALKHLVAGSPLQTLCLLIGGSSGNEISNAYEQIRENTMLDGWEENLAIITANRTRGDEIVITYLGDCLWKERAEVMAAHTCYLIAESNFEPYSDRARLCLIGADHLKFPRTYASPDAIQRTELYEYSKVLGNPQFVLLPFQPYKLVYAHMLAEVGKVAESLKYCQAILKSLRTGRGPEVDMLKQLTLSLEDQLKTHQQGGYGIARKFLTFLDNTAQKVVGGLPPPPTSTPATATSQNSFDHREYYQPVGSTPQKSFEHREYYQPAGSTPQNSFEHREYYQPPGSTPQNSFEHKEYYQPSGSTAQNSFQHMEHYQPSGGQNVNSHSTMALPSMVPSASMEPIGKWNGETDQPTVPNRSISEPDFGSKPEKVHPSKEASRSHTEAKASTSSGSSRFGRFGSQLFQKTVGLVIRSRPDRQAKLGEKNKFYYDEKLKRWVEEGAEPPPEEAAIPPPPTIAAFQSGLSNHMEGASEAETLHGNNGPEYKAPPAAGQSPGIPPVPPSSNQFSTRGRMGVRSRYVDTFNKGGGTQTSSFRSPPVQTAKPKIAGSPNFFIPAPITSDETTKQSDESMAEAVLTNEIATASLGHEPMPSPSTSMPSPAITQRFSDMDKDEQKPRGGEENGDNAVPSVSWQTASWSGSPSNFFNPVKPNEINSPVETFGMSPPSYMNNDLQSKQFSNHRSNSMDELDEIQL